MYYCDFSDFWQFVLYKVVQRRSQDVVGYLIIALLPTV